MVSLKLYYHPSDQNLKEKSMYFKVLSLHDETLLVCIVYYLKLISELSNIRM